MKNCLNRRFYELKPTVEMTARMSNIPYKETANTNVMVPFDYLWMPTHYLLDYDFGKKK